MDEILFRVLADAIARYLALAELSQQPRSASRQLATAWRTMLRLHRPTVRGRCPGCMYRRGEMCDVWRVAVAYFVRPAESAGPASGEQRQQPRPPRPDPNPAAGDS